MGALKATIVLAAMLLLGGPLAFGAGPQCLPGSIEIMGGDAFPLNCPLKFPWGTIEGNWELKNAGVYSAYSFEVQSTCDGRDILRIRQFNVITGKVLSEGIGYKATDSQEVRAIMKGVQGDHLLHVGAYFHKLENRSANILRIVPLDNPHGGKAWELIRFNFTVRNHTKTYQAQLTCVDDRE